MLTIVPLASGYESKGTRMGFFKVGVDAGVAPDFEFFIVPFKKPDKLF